MKLRSFFAIFIVGAIGFAAFSANKEKHFAPAEDFPREALVYVQIADLPQFIKLWNESEFKEKYTTSQNFEEFQNNHLGRKLASRLKEFGAASGFSFDLETVSNLAENKAAFALYDIGKLEFVFIAPVRDEVFAATKFVQNQSNFTEETLEDGTTIYRAAVEADRGRQKQKLIFTNAKGHFVLATSEKLIVETLNNINGKGAKNRLTDEPSFASLSRKIEPHAATVWVNQEILNSDYYFKRYWLMSETEDLQNIRAGIFDFEIQEEKLVERRKFLLKTPANISPISALQSERLLKFLPENVPFYRVEKADSKTVRQMIEKTIFERRKEETKRNKSRRSDDFSLDYSDNFSDGDYDYSGESFDENINETEERETVERNETAIDFSDSLQSANPQAVLSFAVPNLSPAPLFIEFKRAAIFSLALPAGFNRSEFEAKIAQNFSAQMLVSSPNAELNWETKAENNLTWRELKLPMLDWKAVYALRGNELILANNTDFLREILSAKNSQNVETKYVSVTKLTVVNLEEKDNAYTKIFTRLEETVAADSFFTGNIESFLDSISEVKKIEVRQSYSQDVLEEELTFFR